MWKLIFLLLFVLFAALSWFCFQMLVKSKHVSYEVANPAEYEKNFDLPVEDMIKRGIIIEHVDYHYPVYFTAHRISLVLSALCFVVVLCSLVYECFA